MTERIYGNDIKVYIDGILVGTQSRIEEGSIQVTIPKDVVSEEGFHIIGVDPVPIQEFVDSINNGIEIEGSINWDKFIIKRKRKDDKELKLSRKLRKGWS